MPRIRILLAACAAVLSAPPLVSQGYAQQPSSTSDAAPGNTAQGEGAASLGQRVQGDLGKAAGTLGGGGQDPGTVQKVLDWLHQSNTTAIQGGKLAQQNGGSNSVKQLGAKLVTDHSALEKEAAAVAAARGIHLPGTGPSSSQGQTQQGTSGASTAQGAGAGGLAALQKRKGSAFDSAFLSWLSNRQQQDATQARTALADAQKSGDTGVAALLSKVAPQLESHAQAAQSAQEQAVSSPQRQGRTGE